MTVSSNLASALKVLAGAALMVLVAACSTIHHHPKSHHGHHKGSEQAGQSGTPAADPDDPNTMHELKRLPKGLLPDTQNAVHTTEPIKVE